MYELQEQEGELKIFRLAAHWELRPMLKQQMQFGMASVGAGMAASWRMLRFLGPMGTLRFMKAVSSVGDIGKESVYAFVNAFNQKNQQHLMQLMSKNYRCIAFPASGPFDKNIELTSLPGELSVGKMLSAGNFVSANFVLEKDGKLHYGVAFFEFSMGEKKIDRLSFFWQ